MNPHLWRAIRFTIVISTAALAYAAQAPAPPTAAATKAPLATGLEAPWDVRKIVAALLKDNEELKPVIARLTPQQWYEKKGAPSTYIVQWTSAQRQVNDVVIASQLLSQNTESLSLAVDAYFRLEALETTARSLNEGAQKYEDRGTADRLSELIARNFDDRQRFRDYIRDLATSQEQDFKIADQEAQRCRGMISKESPAVSKRSKRN
jgi:hypothetical protein